METTREEAHHQLQIYHTDGTSLHCVCQSGRPGRATQAPGPVRSDPRDGADCARCRSSTRLVTSSTMSLSVCWQGLGGWWKSTVVKDADPTLRAAFGRRRCAEQSVVQDTLNACTAENVRQMKQAMDMIYRQHGQCCRIWVMGS